MVSLKIDVDFDEPDLGLNGLCHINADWTGIIGALGLQATDADGLRKDLLGDSIEPAEPVPFTESITPGWWTALDEGCLQPFFRTKQPAPQVHTARQL